MDLAGASQWVALYVGEMPSTETVDRVFFRIQSATTGCDALVRIETVDTSTGLPTGTLVHANASQSVTITSGAADYTVTFPGSFSLAKQPLIAIVVAVSSGTPSAVYFALLQNDSVNRGLPYQIDYDASAAVRLTSSPACGLGIAGGSAISLKYCWPVSSFGTSAYQATSTPDTVGNQIVIPAKIRVCGAWALIDPASTGKLNLYDTDGATVLAYADIYANVPPTTTISIAHYQFSSAVELPAGTYWLAAEATGGANLNVPYCVFPAADFRAGSPMGGGMMTYATCTQTPAGTGDWTLTDTRQSFMGLVVDGIEDGAGGSGGGETSHVFAA